MTEFLGFEMLDGEYKVMGMAPYGDPDRYPLDRLIRKRGDGFEVDTTLVNTVGLRRHGFSTETIQALKRAYRILFRSNLPLHRAIERVRQEVPPFPEVERLLQFLCDSDRGVCR